MPVKYIWLAPVLTVGFGVAAFVTGYAIAVGRGYEEAWFSYISDGGTHPPESCVFGQLLNLSAVFLAISVYLRHRQIVVFYHHNLRMPNGWWRTMSVTLLYIGLFSSFGMSMVANFQETSIPICHLIGAMIAFFGSTVYVWGQIVLSYAMNPHLTPMWMNHFRTFFTSLATGSLVLHMICEHGHPFVKAGADGNIPTPPPVDNDIRRFYPGDPWYVNHIVTTCAEWGLVLSLEVVLLTFAWELRHFYAHLPKVHLRSSVASELIHNESVEIVKEGHHKSYNTNSQTRFGLGSGATVAPADGHTIPRARFNGRPMEVEHHEATYRRNEYVY
uniref:Cytochrome b561 domain-containing protein n=1 Tax=Panagrellus redivivus TaxID=6233 RepID=A0A7E4ZV63_PANRE